MIPKIIHYCWFGRGKMPDLAIRCINSWKKNLPGYEMMLWNEDRFDINSNTYTKEAYENKKYAFVTDYVRLYALYHCGGVYMDTDVEVLKSLDPFLSLPAFSGFEGDGLIPTGIMASEKGGKWARWQLSYYDNKHFLLPNGELDLTTNVTQITKTMVDKGFVLNNTYQNFEDIIHLFPNDYFCPKSYSDGKLRLTQNSVTIHHYAGSWLTPKESFRRMVTEWLGIRNMKRISSLKIKILGSK